MSTKTSSQNRPPRKVADLCTNLEKSLKAYATTAATAGMGFLTLAHSAEAKVVFTPTHQTLLPGGTLKLDLNGDGVSDFSITDVHIVHVASFRSNGYLDARPSLASNEVVHGSNINSEGFAQALPARAMVGSKNDFVNYPQLMAYCLASQGLVTHKSGQWPNTTNRFLGLKFVINGQAHYGWARFTVQLGSGIGCEFKAVLSGYAYETVANQPITTGQATSVHANHLDFPSNSVPSLGILALGTPGLTIWRREEDRPLASGVVPT